MSTRQQKSAEKIQIPCPEIIIDYNKFMGDVDLLDQKILQASLRRVEEKRRNDARVVRLFIRTLLVITINVN